MDTCKTCKHWDVKTPDEALSFIPAAASSVNIGHCELSHFAYSQIGMDLIKSKLYTLDTFGCVQHTKE